MTSNTTSTVERPAGEARATRTKRRLGGDRGAALVEFAIIAPLIFMLLLGLFSGGILLSQRNSTTNAVREAARLGATLALDPGDPDAWAEAVEGRVRDLTSNNVELTEVCVKLVKAPNTDVRSDGTCPTSPGDQVGDHEPSITGVPADDCVVLVWARQVGDLEFLVGSKEVTMDTHSVSTYERECA